EIAALEHHVRHRLAVASDIRFAAYRGVHTVDEARQESAGKGRDPERLEHASDSTGDPKALAVAIEVTEVKRDYWFDLDVIKLFRSEDERSGIGHVAPRLAVGGPD